VAGWLVGWLAGWLAGWPAGWLLGWLAGWLDARHGPTHHHDYCKLSPLELLVWRRPTIPWDGQRTRIISLAPTIPWDAQRAGWAPPTIPWDGQRAGWAPTIPWNGQRAGWAPTIPQRCCACNVVHERTSSSASAASPTSLARLPRNGFKEILDSCCYTQGCYIYVQHLPNC
jgi:hypothetical protein